MELSGIVSAVASGGMSGILGGVTGAFGAVVQRFTEFKMRQLEIQGAREKYVHEVEMRKADAEIMAQEWAARTKVAEVEAQGKVDTAAEASFATALTSEPQRYSDAGKASSGQQWALIVLDVVRGVIRPGLTAYLCWLTTMLYFQSRSLMIVENVADPQALVNKIVGTILYLTTTCVLFYFGTRNTQKAPKI